MKLVVSVLLFVGGLVVMSGCAADPQVSAASESAPNPAQQVAGLHLELDEGQKWEVDEHTRSSAGRLRALVEDRGPFDSVDDARALGLAIEEELRVLIQGCTMTGPAHDQLHAILAALFPRVAELKTESDLGALRETRREIGLILDAYQRHFR